MESKAKFLGHAIHPTLIVFPLGLLAMAAIFDLIQLASGDAGWHAHSFAMIGAGVIAGLIAAVFGLWDWWHIPSGTRAKRVGLAHGVSMVTAVLLYAGSWILRAPSPTEPTMLALGLTFLGAVVALFGGWLGGELVDRLGVGVDPGANLNAPNSLSGRVITPAAPTRTPVSR